MWTKVNPLKYHIFYAFRNDTGSLYQALQDLLANAPWEQGYVKIFGKTHKENRLSCLISSSGGTYTYSGRIVKARRFDCSLCPHIVPELLKEVSQFCGVEFNSVLLNLYRGGKDYIGWHADDETLYGQNPTIAGISLGATRDFQVKLKPTAKEAGVVVAANFHSPFSLSLENASLLVMAGPMQRFWLHSVPKRMRLSSESVRISLTFRKALTH